MPSKRFRRAPTKGTFYDTAASWAGQRSGAGQRGAIYPSQESVSEIHRPGRASPPPPCVRPGPAPSLSPEFCGASRVCVPPDSPCSLYHATAVASGPGGGRGGANRGPGDTLDARNFRGLKTQIWALFWSYALFAGFREKVRSSFAVSGPISPARGIM